MGPARSLPIVVILLLLAGWADAHPVPRDSHDRFISVTLREGSKPGLVRVDIVYRLEVDEFTVIQQDMRDYRDQVDPGLFANKPLEYYAEYSRIYADIIARNLIVKVDGAIVPLRSGERSQTLKDEKTNEPLGHVRCTFHYSGEFPIKPDAVNLFDLRETNFRDQEGQIHFSFVNQAQIAIGTQVVPDPALNKLHPLERPLDFDAKMRTLTLRFVALRFPVLGASVLGLLGNPAGQGPWLVASAHFAEMEDGGRKTEVGGQKSEVGGRKTEDLGPRTEAQPREQHDHDDMFIKTYRWLSESKAGIWLILLVFVGLGAAHALTPGHGKTLVAAYLVGEHGTIWHAVLLGLVTTITHTGVVIVIALVLFFLPESMSAQARQSIQTGLGLVLGISVTCLGCWLLLQRLSGRADHIHLGGGHDHHYHHRGPVGQTANSATETRPARRRLGLSGIIVLGVNGGLIPCWDAVAILAAVVGTNEFWLALPALLAFSAGLAGVLVVIGILVVQFRNFAGSRWGEGRFVRLLPLLSAVIVTCMGLYLCCASLPRNGR